MIWFLLIFLELMQTVSSQSDLVKGVCGKPSLPRCFTTRVVKGASSCAERIPWNVLIEHKTKNKGKEAGIYPYCGAVLITEKHVISAAHCYWQNRNLFGVCPRSFGSVDGQECLRSGCPSSCTRVAPSEIIAHFGLTSRRKQDEGQSRNVARIEIHPGWDRSAELNDILDGHDLALLTLTASVDISGDRTKPICLPTSKLYYPSEGHVGVVSGFGVDVDPRDGENIFPVQLQSAELSIKSAEMCRNAWSTRGNQICALGRATTASEGGSGQLTADSCNGDSGGPLTRQRGADRREVLLGIVSFGELQCGRKGGRPGVYTNIAEHLDWISERVNQQQPTVAPPTPAPSRTCTTVKGRKCKFPFKFQGKTFASCTREFDPDSKPWCSTKTDLQGNHVVNEGEWGYCPSDCPVDILNVPGKEVPNAPSGWSHWSSCSVTCGQGSRSRQRNICPRVQGDCTTREFEDCSEGACPTRPSISGWGAWSSCTQSCGVGTQSRTRLESTVTQQRGCNADPCPGASSSTSDRQVSFQACQFSGTCPSSSSSSLSQSSAASSSSSSSSSSQSPQQIKVTIIRRPSNSFRRPPPRGPPRGGPGGRPPPPPPQGPPRGGPGGRPPPPPPGGFFRGRRLPRRPGPQPGL